MTGPALITRIAARGDGVTVDGRHAPGAAPGDVLLADGRLEHGPHHVAPPCRHFGRCGGCQLQHCDDSSLAQFVSDRVIHAAQAHGIVPENTASAHLSPPMSRRRATLHAANGGGKASLGFREGGAHRIVDMVQCEILVPEFVPIIAALRKLLSRRKGKFAADIELTLLEQGVDLGLKGVTVEGLEQTEAMLDFARDLGLARLTLDQGYGAEALWEPEPVSIGLSDISVPFPPGAFLQATADGEAALASAAREWLAGSATIADLFSGLGTFAFALAGDAKVLAVEAARDAHLACKAAASRSGRPIHAMHRDLFRNPLLPEELNRFSAVLLDPPRAGAREQVGRLAQSTVAKIVYVSCNPSSWARDAQVLAAAGYRLVELRPVGQFRWSTHVELASLFVR